MKKIAVLFHDGFEEIEALTIVDVMRRANFICEMIGFDQTEVTGSHKIKIKMDRLYEDVCFDYDAVVIPGGLPGATNLRDDERVIDFIKDHYLKGKVVAAICAGPIVLQKAELLNERKVTCYPGFENELDGACYEESLVKKDGNIITGKGPAAALEFAYEILEALGQNSAKLKEDMQYDYLKKNI